MLSALRNIVIAHVILITAVAIVLYLWRGPATLPAVIYGGVTAFVYGVIQYWRMEQAKRLAADDAQGGFRLAIRAEIERLLAVAVLLAVGFAVLKLAPLPLIVAFVAGVILQVLIALGPTPRANEVKRRQTDGF